MKGGLQPRGFTIVETLIVLAVTGGMLVLALAFINGRQNRAQFTQGVRDMESRLQQVISEVNNGFYPNDGNFNCAPGGTGPILSTGGGVQQGGNKDCIFLGKVIQFAVGADDSPTFHIYSVVGLRETAPGAGLVNNLAQAKPRLIARGDSDSGTVPNIYTTGQLRYGLTVSNNGMRYGATNIGAVGFVSRLGAQLGADNTSQQVDLLAITGTSLGQPAGAAIDAIRNSMDSLPSSAVNPAGGVAICLNSGGTRQSALITIGGVGRKLPITVDIKNTLDCA